MFAEILNIVFPIFFVLLLGYAAGRTNQFDSHQVAGINELVLNFAVPASLFVGTVGVSRTQLLRETPLLMAMLVSLVGMYIVVFLLGKMLFRHTVGGAALQAIAVSFTAGPFFGSAVLSPIFGTSSAVAISMIALIRTSSLCRRPWFSDEGLLLTALPSGPIGILLATRYKTYEAEASSTVAVTMILIVPTIPIALWVMRGA